MKKCLKTLLGILIIATYMNIGWAISSYYANHTCEDIKNSDTLEMIVNGPDGFKYPHYLTTINNCLIKERIHNHRIIHILSSLTFPFLITVSLASWIAAICYYSFWLVFLGGSAEIVAKLLGNEGVQGVIIVLMVFILFVLGCGAPLLRQDEPQKTKQKITHNIYYLLCKSRKARLSFIPRPRNGQAPLYFRISKN